MLHQGFERRVGSLQNCLHVFAFVAIHERGYEQVGILSGEAGAARVKTNNAGICLKGCRPDKNDTLLEQPGVGDDLEDTAERKRGGWYSRLLDTVARKFFA